MKAEDKKAEEKKEVDPKEAAKEAKKEEIKKKKDEPKFEMLANPARVMIGKNETSPRRSKITLERCPSQASSFALPITPNP